MYASIIARGFQNWLEEHNFTWKANVDTRTACLHELYYMFRGFMLANHDRSLLPPLLKKLENMPVKTVRTFGQLAMYMLSHIGDADLKQLDMDKDPNDRTFDDEFESIALKDEWEYALSEEWPAVFYARLKHTLTPADEVL